MKSSDMFPSNYFNTDDVRAGELRVTIESISQEEMRDESRKWILRFAGETKGLVMKPVLQDQLDVLFGDETEDWIGKEIILYFDPTVMYGNKRTGSIRIKSASARRAAPARSAPGPAQAARNQATAQRHYDERNPPSHERAPMDDDLNDFVP